MRSLCSNSRLYAYFPHSSVGVIGVFFSWPVLFILSIMHIADKDDEEIERRTGGILGAP